MSLPNQILGTEHYKQHMCHHLFTPEGCPWGNECIFAHTEERDWYEGSEKYLRTRPTTQLEGSAPLQSLARHTVPELDCAATRPTIEHNLRTEPRRHA